jgi:hypothetical protein
MSKSLTLIRDYKSEATLGILKDSSGDEICRTLERPNLSNAKDNPKTAKNESGCIPEGIYLCKRYSSPKYPNTWEIIGVPGRSKILIHTANTIDELLGCVATATKIIDSWALYPKEKGSISPDKRWFGESSKKAFTKLKDYIGDEDITLTITSNKTLCNVS